MTTKKMIEIAHNDYKAMNDQHVRSCDSIKECGNDFIIERLLKIVLDLMEEPKWS